jgi:hypothetical protein
VASLGYRVKCCLKKKKKKREGEKKRKEHNLLLPQQKFTIKGIYIHVHFFEKVIVKNYFNLR